MSAKHVETTLPSVCLIMQCLTTIRDECQQKSSAEELAMLSLVTSLLRRRTHDRYRCLPAQSMESLANSNTFEYNMAVCRTESASSRKARGIRLNSSPLCTSSLVIYKTEEKHDFTKMSSSERLIIPYPFLRRKDMHKACDEWVK